MVCNSVKMHGRLARILVAPLYSSIARAVIRDNFVQIRHEVVARYALIAARFTAECKPPISLLDVPIFSVLVTFITDIPLSTGSL